jgi:peroxiredoxin
MTRLRIGTRARLLAVTLLGALMAFSACSKEKKTEQQPERQAPNVIIESLTMAPDVPLRSMDGHTEFISDFKGKIVLLNFWSTTNVDCREQVQVLNELAAEYDRYKVVVLGVSIDRGGAGALANFVQTTAVKYPVFYNGSEAASKFGGVRKLPTTYFIARDGRIYDKVLGTRTKSFYMNKIKEILSQRV